MADTLLPSPRGVSSMLDKLSTRFEDLKALHQRVRGYELQMDDNVKLSIKYIDNLANRHLKKDYRHNMSELQAMENLAEWMVGVKMELVNSKIWVSGSTRDWKHA